LVVYLTELEKETLKVSLKDLAVYVTYIWKMGIVSWSYPVFVMLKMLPMSWMEKTLWEKELLLKLQKVVHGDLVEDVLKVVTVIVVHADVDLKAPVVADLVLQKAALVDVLTQNLLFRKRSLVVIAAALMTAKELSVLMIVKDLPVPILAKDLPVLMLVIVVWHLLNVVALKHRQQNAAAQKVLKIVGDLQHLNLAVHVINLLQINVALKVHHQKSQPLEPVHLHQPDPCHPQKLMVMEKTKNGKMTKLLIEILLVKEMFQNLRYILDQQLEAVHQNLIVQNHVAAAVHILVQDQVQEAAHVLALIVIKEMDYHQMTATTTF
jgi:hypothetical protein